MRAEPRHSSTNESGPGWFQEERTIKEKILAYADMSGEKSLSLSLATQFFKQEMERLKVIYPERDFKNLSVTTGEAFDYMWSRR